MTATVTDPNDQPDAPVRRVCVGAIAGAFGVHGEARLKPFTAEPDALVAYGPLETEDGARRFEARLTRVLKDGIAARLSGVESREAAQALRGVRLYVPRAALPEPADEDEYYQTDLIGLRAVGLDGVEFGRVRAVHDFGAGDMLEIADPRLKAPALLPFTRAAAPHVDLARGEVVIDPPEGVFEWTDAAAATETEIEAETDTEDGAAP